MLLNFLDVVYVYESVPIVNFPDVVYLVVEGVGRRGCRLENVIFYKLYLKGSSFRNKSFDRSMGRKLLHTIGSTDQPTN